MRFDQARWRGPVPNESQGAMGVVRGLVLHIEQGSEAGTDNWFHNPGAEASAHFGNPKSGPLDQWVDTADKAWAEVAGNASWISVEHEGYSGEALTPNQLHNDGELLAWLHLTHGVPLALANDPAGRGVGYHAMGGAAWGGHLQCPGQPIIDQRQAIVDLAAVLVGGPTLNGDPDMFTYSTASDVDGGSIWLVVAGVAHRLHLPEDAQRLDDRGVLHLGQMTAAFHNVFEHRG